MPVGRAPAVLTSTSVIGTAAADPGGTGCPARPAERRPGRAIAGTRISVTVPQPWHSPHRPAHFVLRQPHSEH